MGKVGNTWRGVERITKTGETDQGVTDNPDIEMGESIRVQKFATEIILTVSKCFVINVVL